MVEVLARTKKITIEVEVPEGLDHGLFEKFLVIEASRLTAALLEWGDRLPERDFTREEEKLLKEIKKGIARRAEKGMRR